jgi:phosphoglycerate dehydrogenase-like enzyme
MSTSPRPKSAFFINDPKGFWAVSNCAIEAIYGKGRKEQIAGLTDLYPHLICPANFEEHIPNLKSLEVIFSTWSMPRLTAEQIEKMPQLKAVFYAAGGTAYFRKPFMDKGIICCSGTEANAVPVAEFCLGQILLTAKGFFRNTAACATREGRINKPFVGLGSYGAKVSLLGNGAISRKLQELLKPFRLDVEVIPSRQMTAQKLEEVFETSYIVSNHLPDREDNKGLLNRAHFSRMPHGATFINTGRGGQVNEADMAAVLSERKDLTALLDVQDPEPPLEGSPLYTLPNVHMSSHIAGTYNDEYQRLADYMIEEFIRWKNNEPLLYRVTDDML